MPEAEAPRHDLTQRAVRIVEAYLQRIQVRVVVVPDMYRAGHGERHVRGALAVLRGLRADRFAVEHADVGAARIAGQAQRHADIAMARRHVELRAHPQVLDMRRGEAQQADAAEDAEEAEEVLILEVRGGAALVHLDGEQVARLAHGTGQIELRGGEGVLGIADELPVEPDIHRLLHALKADDHALAAQRRVEVERLHIGADGVVVRTGKLTLRLHAGQAAAGRAAEIVALPGVHGVDVMEPVVAGQLDVPRNGDLAEGGAVKGLPVELRRALRRALRIGELPDAVKALAQCILSGGILRLALEEGMIAVRVEPVHAEHLRVVQPSDVGLHAYSFPARTGGLLFPFSGHYTR